MCRVQSPDRLLNGLFDLLLFPDHRIWNFQRVEDRLGGPPDGPSEIGAVAKVAPVAHQQQDRITIETPQGFRGGPKTHGQSDRWRAPGSIGSGTTPGRVVKGLRMAGHMGAERVTVKNLKILRVDPERNIVAVQGAVPGPRGGLLLLKKRVAP